MNAKIYCEMVEYCQNVTILPIILGLYIIKQTLNYIHDSSCLQSLLINTSIITCIMMLRKEEHHTPNQHIDII